MSERLCRSLLQNPLSPEALERHSDHSVTFWSAAFGKSMFDEFGSFWIIKAHESSRFGGKLAPSPCHTDIDWYRSTQPDLLKTRGNKSYGKMWKILFQIWKPTCSLSLKRNVIMDLGWWLHGVALPVLEDHEVFKDGIQSP